MPSEHARLSPSAAHRWMACPSSLGEIEHNGPAERKSSKYADEGTAAHELAERTLREGHRSALELEGEMAQNGHLFDEPMCNDVDIYIKAVRGFADGHTLHVEQRVDFSHVIGVPNSFGTADGIVLTADGFELQLHDLKFGRGVQVFATRNEQLMLYALGALRQFDLLGDIETVRLVIHQPRIGHLDEWTVSSAELRAFGKQAREAATKAIELADGGTSEDLLKNLNAGPKQCKFCPVKATCPAQLEMAASGMRVDISALLEGTGDVVEEAIKRTAQLSNAELAALLPKLDTIVDWTKAIRARVETELLQGNEVPGYKLVEGKKGPRSWTNKDFVEDLLKNKFRIKVDEMYKMELQSPTTVEKLLKASPHRWGQLIEFIAQSDGKPSVAPLGDKRPALALTADVSALLGDVEDQPET